MRQSRATGFSALGHNFQGDGKPDVGDDGNDDGDNGKGDDEWRPLEGENADLFDAGDGSSEEEDEGSEYEEEEDEGNDGEPKTKKRRKSHGSNEGANKNKKKKRTSKTGKRKLVKGSIGSRPAYNSDDSEAWDEEAEEDDDDEGAGRKKIKRLTKVHDDGDYKTYKRRVENYEKNRVKSKEKDVEFEGDSGGGNLKVPGELWAKLYPYQRTGVRWLWELHQQVRNGRKGGNGEMGVGDEEGWDVH